MGQIPIGRTIAETLGFTFGRYFSVLGVVWLPILLLGVAYYYTIMPFIEQIAMVARAAALHPHQPPPQPNIASFNRMAPVLNLVAILTMAWMQAGVTKTALGLRRTFPFAYIAFGMDELRLVAANLVIFALAYGAIVAVALVVLAVAGIGAALASGGLMLADDQLLMKSWGIYALIGAIAVAALTFLYFQIRLTFFLAPITVVEKRFGLWRSWEMTRHTVWPIVAVILVIVLLFLAVEIALTAIVAVPVGMAIADAVKTGASADPLTVFKPLKPFLPFVGLLFLLVMPLFIGLQVGPSAFAYRALTDSNPA
jgi:hypothetical protein